LDEEVLQFAPIDLGQHAALCVEFRIDSYVCSFGSADKFYVDHGGEQQYLDWLRHTMLELPGSCVHLWAGRRIVGQLELGRSHGGPENSGPEIAQVNLYYLVPEVRSTGVSDCLDNYVGHFCARLGLRQAQLNVSPSNHRAIRHYEKHAWKNRGSDPRHPDILLFEKGF
jgi:RimJ/RimL family protein N-acetyltransferase